MDCIVVIVIIIVIFLCLWSMISQKCKNENFAGTPSCHFDQQCKSNEGEFCNNSVCTRPGDIGLIDSKTYYNPDRSKQGISKFHGYNAAKCKQICIDDPNCGGITFVPSASDCYTTIKSIGKNFWSSAYPGMWGWQKS